MSVGPPLATAKKLGEATHRQRLLPVQAEGQRRRFGDVRPGRLPHRQPPEEGRRTARRSSSRPGRRSRASLDAAGAAFWFNGQDALSLNPAFAAVAPTARSSPTPAPSRSSPACPREKPKPMTVKFTKAGTYKVYCDIHPGMEAIGQGRQEGRDGPDGQAGRGRGQEAGRRRRQGRQGPREDRTRAPTPSTSASPAKGGVEYFGMVPANLTVAPGTTVKFQMTKGSYEAHTATFGPGNIEDPASYIGGDRGVVRVARDRPAAASTRATSRRSPLNPTTHGNGFWNSGVPGRVERPFPSPSSVVKFQMTKGTYEATRRRSARATSSDPKSYLGAIAASLRVAGDRPAGRLPERRRRRSP